MGQPAGVSLSETEVVPPSPDSLVIFSSKEPHPRHLIGLALFKTASAHDR